MNNGDYTEYGYDNTYQLTSETKKNSGDTTLYSYSYTYDGVGNRGTMVHFDGTNTTNYTYSYNNLNQLTSKSDGATTTTTYTYDDNGNLIQKSVIANDSEAISLSSWTYENKMKAVTLPDSSVTTFSYNPEGLRIKKIDSGGTTKYVLDGLAVLKEYDDSNNLLATYTPGISIRKNSNSYWYNYDGLGSITTTTDSSQSIENAYTYDAFGNQLSSSGSLTQPYRYVGQQYYYSEGDIGLQLLGQRWYDAEIGRFVNRDPIVYNGGINLYAYVVNNVINLNDPTGEIAIYGNWCGPGWPDAATLAEGIPRTVDCVDAACKVHDECYGRYRVRWWNFEINPFRRYCDLQLCNNTRRCDPCELEEIGRGAMVVILSWSCISWVL
ncbi:MAG TPA: RHS repeat-associated core domain-containing protein [bacterium]|nr:RHS repeat-associated core domain-containing protein [bacterium]